MTQEFESTFLQPSGDSKTNTVTTTTTDTNQINIDAQEFDSTFTQTNVDATISFLNDVIEEEENNHKSLNIEFTELASHEIETKDVKVNDIKLITEVIKPVETLKALCGQVLESKPLIFTSKAMRPCSGNEAINKSQVNLQNENIQINKSDGQKTIMDESSGACEHRSSSPVFKTKTKKLKAIENLVVPLEDFEKFEKIALTFIDIEKDLETCKHLINSQILEGELCLNAENGDIFHDDDDQLSPILEKSGEIIIKDSRDKGSDSLKDEILFSSDEENDFIYKEFHDMPLTAILETSFYDYSDVLDKTMLVGFQTANNNSIQISVDSFHKAQSILDADNDCNNFSMKELVEIYNEKGFSIINSKTEDVKLVENCSDSPTKRNSPNKDEGPIEKKEPEKPIHDTAKNPSENPNFVGFITASNKQIKIPDKALELGKKVFVDIDWESKNLVMQNDPKLDIKDANILNIDTKDNSQVENYNDNKIDDLLIQELENIEMSLEETASKDTTLDFKNVCSEGKDNLKDIQFEGLDEIFKSDANKDIITVTESKFVGFQTANNNNIKVSAEAMAKTKAIFKDIDTVISKVDNVYLSDDENHKSNCNKPSASFVGFKTANNTAIKLADAAKQKSCNIFKDIDYSENIMKEKPNSIDLHNDSINDEVIEKIIEWRKTFDYTNTGNIKDNANRSNSKSPKNDIMTLPKKCSARMKKMFENLALNHPHDNEPSNDDSKDQNNIFKGFQTASKKPVNISGKALQKSKKIFQEVDSYNKANPFEEKFATETKKRSVSKEDYARKLTKDVSSGNVFVDKRDSNNFEGFRTASNKKVAVTKEAIISRSKRILDFDTSPVNNKVMAETVKNHLQPSSNKEVEVSNETIKHTTGLLNNIEIPKIKDDHFKGFQTASNKRVIISKEALEKTKSLFSDIEMPEKEQVFSGFQTETNKKVDVSQEAIKTNFGDIALLENKDIGIFKGFQTASNKQVQISEKALEITKAVFGDIEIPVIELQGCKVFDKIEISKEAMEKSNALFNDVDRTEIKEQSFSGFQTANHEKVELSKEAIQKTKTLFSDIELPENDGTFKGFQTASNKKVKISKEALEKTRALFNDIVIPDIKEQSFKGFQTASNKNVEVSKEALEKTKALFNDIPDIEEQVFKGFKTASNKNVKISEEALKKTKALFDDIEIPENKDNGTFLGFQTGNKKKVTISEQALAKSRQFLQNVDKTVNDINEEVNLNDLNRHESYFKNANNGNMNVSKDDLINSKKMLDNPKPNKNTEIPNKTKDIKTNNLDTLINTQVLDHFEKSLYTEDFNESPKRNKRSGSPILSCPRAKKRKKFEAPYKEHDKKPVEVKQAIVNPKTVATKVIFSEGYKKNKVLTIQDLPNDSKKVIDPYILQFTLDDILNFIFEKDRNELTDTKITITDLKEIFLSAVNKNFVPEGWLDNHIKLILWKLLSYEIKFDFKCTVQSVIDQLKYRYDKELYNAERSAFRKILEKDDVATKTMVLCVAGVNVEGASVIR